MRQPRDAHMLLLIAALISVAAWGLWSGAWR